MLTVHNTYNALTVLNWISEELKGGTYMKAKEDYPDRVHFDQMVLWVVRRGGWTAWAVAKGNLRPPDSSPLKSDSFRDGQAWRLNRVSGDQTTLKVKLSLTGN
jgi:hypothetical protein